MVMDQIQTIDYINAFQQAVDTLVLCSGYDKPKPKTNFEKVEEQYKAYMDTVDEDIFNIECLINEIREQIKQLK